MPSTALLQDSKETLLWEEVLEGFAAWTHVLKRGTALRLTALGENANVAAMFLNADLPTERLNLPDTLKAQHIARLTRNNVLFSDMGRVLLSITADTAGWHDPLGGCADATAVAAMYGGLDYQAARNGWHQNSLNAFTNELAKQGLSGRDLMMNINFFSKVQISDDGGMHFVPRSAPAESSVTLRAEMNTLCILVNCQHPMDPNPIYQQTPVKVEVVRVDPAGPDDPCRHSSPEATRGFTLTERYFL
ncbi:MAG: urea amidolyase associated protein UAAP1 [Janthinobacterium lividum]